MDAVDDLATIIDQAILRFHRVNFCLILFNSLLINRVLCYWMFLFLLVVICLQRWFRLLMYQVYLRLSWRFLRRLVGRTIFFWRVRRLSLGQLFLLLIRFFCFVLLVNPLQLPELPTPLVFLHYSSSLPLSFSQSHIMVARELTPLLHHEYLIILSASRKLIPALAL